MIQPCPKCGNQPHSQDELHGKGNRVFIHFKNLKDDIKRCTRCGYETRSGVATAAAKKEKAA